MFSERLAEPLDDYVVRDADEVVDYFDDVHPSLVEAFLYQGSLFQMPTEFNAANLYYNNDVLASAGLSRPPDDWTHDDFLSLLRATDEAATGSFRPFFWTNRLWGGVVPWLYINDTSFLVEEQAAGGGWFWERFYPGETGRSGGPLWPAANANDPRVAESFEFLRQTVAEGLASSPAQGGGGELISLFAQGLIGATPAGGFWAQGLANGGMPRGEFDVLFFPKWRSQRHQFGAAGYMMMQTSERKDQAWEWIKFATSREGMQIAMPQPTTTPSRRSMVNEAFYAETGPPHWQVFYDTLDRFPTTGPIPAPPQQAAVESALIKNVLPALTGTATDVQPALDRMQRDLELALGGGR